MSAVELDMDRIIDDRRTRIIVCCGSGGVGKTTAAAAIGLRAAERGRQACVLTVDPARRLAQSMGQTQARGAILVISADADRTVPVAAPLIARMCKQGDRVQWERYPDIDPGRVIGDSARDQITWIEARFAGRPAPANCP
jgi:hypothetical protein